MHIILRDMMESDIKDYVRWFTEETSWVLQDTPWEPLDTTVQDEQEGWSAYYEAVRQAPLDITRPKFEITADDVHIGWVSMYHDLEFYPATDAAALGIVLAEPAHRGKGIGTEALRQYIGYLQERGYRTFYAETWSGNLSMCRVLEKLGFVEVHRVPAIRTVAEATYDALTYRLEV